MTAQLYRITYLREGFPRSVTFFAADAVEAAAWSEVWEALAGVEVLTIKPIGISKFPEHPWQRTSQALPGAPNHPGSAADASELTQEELFQSEISNG